MLVTKIEANANRYTFVWGNAIKTNMQRMSQQLESIWNYAEGIAREELKDKRPTDFTPVNADAVKQTIDTINEVLKDKEVNKKVKQKPVGGVFFKNDKTKDAVPLSK